jgi:hypothetical protein
VAELTAVATETPAVSDPPTAQPEVADPAIAAAERVVFLALASELARERKVLVVDDGASALSGIAAHLENTTLGELPGIATGSYDLVVADFTQVDEEALAAVEHLARVVDAATGIALLRAPNRPEFAVLTAALPQGFSRSLPLRQHNWVTSALFDDAMFENDDPSRAVLAVARKMAAAHEGEQLYNTFVATRGEFPTFRPQAVLTRAPDLARTLAELAGERAAAEQQRADYERRLGAAENHIRELEDDLAWYDENGLAIRERAESSALLSRLLKLWAKTLANLGRARRVLGG